MAHQLFFIRQQADLGRLHPHEGDVAQWPGGNVIWQYRGGAWVQTAATVNQPAALFGPQPMGTGFLHIANDLRDAVVPDGLTIDVPVADESVTVLKTLHFVKGLLVEITDGA